MGIEALVEFMDIEVHPDAMAIMDSFGPEMEFFQNIATNTCGDGWNHCRAQEATVVEESTLILLTFLFPISMVLTMLSIILQVTSVVATMVQVMLMSLRMMLPDQVAKSMAIDCADC